MARTSYIMVNTDEYNDFPRPISHKVVNIAGVGMRKAMSSQGQLEQV
jgi:hypothetical protein